MDPPVIPPGKKQYDWSAHEDFLIALINKHPHEIYSARSALLYLPESWKEVDTRKFSSKIKALRTKLGLPSKTNDKKGVLK